MEKYSCIIVEDDPAVIELLESFAEAIPYLDIVGYTKDITEASMIIEKKKPDILLIDLTVPGIEGPEFAFLLDHQPEMILMGEKTKDASDNYFVEIGEYLEKPGDQESFKTAVDICIENLEMYRV